MSDALSDERLAEIKRDWPTLTIVQELLTAYSTLLREKQAVELDIKRLTDMPYKIRCEKQADINLRLAAENTTLRAQLAAAEARVKELEGDLIEAREAPKRRLIP